VVWLKIGNNDISEQDTELFKVVVVWLKIGNNDIGDVKELLGEKVVVYKHPVLIF